MMSLAWLVEVGVIGALCDRLKGTVSDNRIRAPRLPGLFYMEGLLVHPYCLCIITPVRRTLLCIHEPD